MTEILLAPYGSQQSWAPNSSGVTSWENYPLFYQLDLLEHTPLPYSRSIIDLTDLSDGGPGELLGGGSKTFTFPGTKKNNSIFGFIFDVNIADCTFNTRKKSLCIIKKDGIPIVHGILQLQTITKNKESIQYGCQVTDGVSNFYTALTQGQGDDNSNLYGYLQNLDFSDLNHTYDLTHITNSWSATPGSSQDGSGGNGYVYPMIDYGWNDLHGWYATEFFPAIYVKDIIDRIFEYAGYSYSSNFFKNISQPSGRVNFKRLIIPFCNGLPQYSATEVINREFSASFLGNFFNIGNSWTLIPFNDTSTAPDFDASSQFNTSTSKWTVGKNGSYKIISQIHCDMSASLGGASFAFYKNGNIISASQIGIGGTANSRIATISWTGTLNAGDVIDVRGVCTINTGDVGIYGASSPDDTYFYNQVVNVIAEGDEMDMNTWTPPNIKMQDFFESIVKMYNLQVEVDLTNPLNLIIEPYDDFYGGEVIDFTKKLDNDQDIVITPMGMLQHKAYLFTYTSDSDFWNKYIQDRFFTYDHQNIYGERQIVTDNDFYTDNNTLQVIFAPTPLVGPPNYTTGIFAASSPQSKILSTIHMGGADNDPINIDGGNTQHQLSNVNPCTIRILYYAGLINVPNGGSWQYSSTIVQSWSAAQTTYPYAGHIDNPFNPTFDLNFGLPPMIFFSDPGSDSNVISNNNLYNAYYLNMMNEITDKDSKVVELYLRLTPYDIVNLSFRKLILIGNTYYKLLEITDYDFDTEAPVKVKLLKSNTSPSQFSGVTAKTGGKGIIGNESLPVVTIISPPPYLQNGSMIGVGGQNNQIGDNSKNILVTGDNNIISGNNIAIHGGSGNTVTGNNLIVINCTNQTINDNNSVYINNAKYPPSASITGAEVDAALGYTPYDSANPDGFITESDITSMAGQATLGTDGDSKALVIFAGVSSTSIIVATPTSTGTLNGLITVTPGAGSFTIQAAGVGSNAVVDWYIVKL